MHCHTSAPALDSIRGSALGEGDLRVMTGIDADEAGAAADRGLVLLDAILRLRTDQVERDAAGVGGEVGLVAEGGVQLRGQQRGVFIQTASALPTYCHSTRYRPTGEACHLVR